MKNKNIKVAFVTDDGIIISPHFGRARYYEVVTIENGNITNRERREKVGHHNFYRQEEHGEHHRPGHGFDENSWGKHRMMAASISDCSIVVARGMGNGAYQHMLSANITPILTDRRTIDEAIQEIIKGTLVNHIEKLH